MTNLKPCPFCGGPADTMEHREQGHRHYHIVIGCRKCSYGMRTEHARYLAIEAWNTRAETTADRLLRHILAENSTLALPQGLPDDELELLKELRG